jgi:hypothetical protein
MEPKEVIDGLLMAVLAVCTIGLVVDVTRSICRRLFWRRRRWKRRR